MSHRPGKIRDDQSGRPFNGGSVLSKKSWLLLIVALIAIGHGGQPVLVVNRPSSPTKSNNGFKEEKFSWLPFVRGPADTHGQGMKKQGGYVGHQDPLEDKYGNQ